MRRSRRATIDHSVPSPCVAICNMDAQNKYCVGCLRTSQELSDWITMTREEKLQVLSEIATRRASSGTDHHV